MFYIAESIGVRARARARFARAPARGGVRWRALASFASFGFLLCPWHSYSSPGRSPAYRLSLSSVYAPYWFARVRLLIFDYSPGACLGLIVGRAKLHSDLMIILIIVKLIGNFACNWCALD